MVARYLGVMRKGSVSFGVQLSILWLLLCVAMVSLSNVFPIPGRDAIDLVNRLHPPIGWGGSWAHILGTDELGRDILSRLIFSLRISLMLAVVGTAISACIGTTLGLLAAHFGGWFEELIVSAIDAQASLPFMVITLAITAFFGTSLVLFVFILGLYGWERFARITRAMTLSALGRGYVQAMRTFGFSWPRIYLRHVLPNIASALLVTATINIPETILLETSLSFLGVGIQPPLSSLGNMLGFGRNYLMNGWWMAVVPGVAIFLCTLAVSTVGDWARGIVGRK